MEEESDVSTSGFNPPTNLPRLLQETHYLSLRDKIDEQANFNLQLHSGSTKALLLPSEKNEKNSALVHPGKNRRAILLI